MAPDDVADGRLPENSNVNPPHSIAAVADVSAEEAVEAVTILVVNAAWRDSDRIMGDRAGPGAKPGQSWPRVCAPCYRISVTLSRWNTRTPPPAGSGGGGSWPCPR